MGSLHINKTPTANAIIGGLALPAPGAVVAVFSTDDGEGEITAPVLGLFIRTETTKYGQAITLDGFTAGGESDELMPVGEVENFRGFRFAGVMDSYLGGGESGKCRYCGNRAETDKAHNACAACLSINDLALAIQEAKGVEV